MLTFFNKKKRLGDVDEFGRQTRSFDDRQRNPDDLSGDTFDDLGDDAVVLTRAPGLPRGDSDAPPPTVRLLTEPPRSLSSEPVFEPRPLTEPVPNVADPGNFGVGLPARGAGLPPPLAASDTQAPAYGSEPLPMPSPQPAMPPLSSTGNSPLVPPPVAHGFAFETPSAEAQSPARAMPMPPAAANRETPSRTMQPGSLAPVNTPPPLATPPQMRVPELPKIGDSAMSLVSKDAVWEGKLNCAGDIRIEGRVNGEVETRGTLFIAAEAHIEGTVRARNVMLAGELTGDLACQERLEILPGGVARGDIETATLVVHEGAFLESKFQMRREGVATR